MEETKKLRRRTNISTSVKGIKTFEVTIDSEGYTEEEHLAQLDSLVTQMENRCPPAEST